MKKITILLMFMILPSFLVAQTNLITNGTFDSDTSGWTTIRATYNSSTQVNSGGAGELNFAGNNTGNDPSASQAITLQPNTTYTVSFKYKWLGGVEASTYIGSAVVLKADGTTAYTVATGSSDITKAFADRAQVHTMEFTFTSDAGINGSANNATFRIDKLITSRALRVDDIVVQSTTPPAPTFTWNGSVSSEWTNASNWTSTAGTIPGSDAAVTIPNVATKPTISATTNVNVSDLTIETDGDLTILGGGSLVVANTATGEFTYKTTLTSHADDDKGWHLATAPVNSGQTYLSFMDDPLNNIATNTANTLRGFARYNNTGETARVYGYFGTGFSGTATFQEGEGFIVKRASAGDISFTGTYPTADESLAINQGTVTGANTGTAEATDFNLVGSPFPNYYSVGDFFTDNNVANTFSENTIWLWDSAANSGAGAYITKTSGNDPTFQIAPGQAFFVKAGSASASNDVTFKRASGKINTTSSTFLKQAKTMVNLSVATDDRNLSTDINFLNNNATDGFDNGYDGSLFNGTSSDFSVYTALIANEAKNLAVQSLPLSDIESYSIPVGVKAAAGKEISFTVKASNLPTDAQVYLEDKLNNTFTRLDESNAVYKTTLSEDLDGIGRFYLHAKSGAALSTNDTELTGVNIYKSAANKLTIAGIPQEKATVSIFNLLGKKVFNTSIVGNSEISLPRFSQGVYLVKLSTISGEMNKKIILE